MSNTDKPTSVRRRALVSKEECPMALASQILGDKWMLLVLREAFYGVQRYDDMLQDLKIPRATLTHRLNTLVEQKIMVKQPYQDAGDRARFGYQLTAMGHDLALTFLALTQWGEKHLINGRAPVAVVNRTTGEELRVALVSTSDEITDPMLARLVKQS